MRMENKMLMNRDKSLLLIIDVQERLAPAMDSPREVITGCAHLVGVAKRLGVPFIITEQYPKGLGATMIDIRQEAGENVTYLPKLDFSCVRDENIFAAIENSGRKQIILAGIETHICITQTAIDLKAAGYDVFVVSDACASRVQTQNILALQRLMKNGIDVVTAEMVMFEWLEKAGTDEFKEISKKYII